MKTLRTLFVAIALFTFASACSQEEEIVMPAIEMEESSGESGDRDPKPTVPSPN